MLEPRKIMRSGLWEAFGGAVMIYIHKEKELDNVARRYPAAHYTLIDDKARILAAAKAASGDRVTTVFPKQGHYAREEPPRDGATADRTIDAIGDLLTSICRRRARGSGRARWASGRTPISRWAIERGYKGR